MMIFVRSVIFPQKEFKNVIAEGCKLALAGQFIMNIFNMKHVEINTFLLKGKWFFIIQF